MRPETCGDFTALTVVIPTRNRAAFARAAIRSVLDGSGPEIHVLVSDNSTRETDRHQLETFCGELGDPRIGYRQAPSPMSMSRHWEWAMERALESADSHVAFLTDRMLFKAGDAATVASLAARHPADVIAYNYDRVDDLTRPVRLQQEAWSGAVVAVAASRLLGLSSRMVWSPALPRMWNCVVPRAVIAAVRGRFGNLFLSVSPDFCFAYRSLTVIDRVLLYDRAVLIEYGLTRSNGEAHRRGVFTEDRIDFDAQLEVPLNSSSPIPALQTVSNAVVHEYCVVARLAGSDLVPKVDRWSYLGAMAWDVERIEDPALRLAMRRRLAEHGWGRADRARWLARKLLSRLLHDRVGFAGEVWRRWRQAPGYPSTGSAIEAALRSPRPRSAGLAHLWQLEATPIEERAA